MTLRQSRLNRAVVISLFLGMCLWTGWAAAAEPWPALNVRGFARRPAFNGNVVDTSILHLRNVPQNAYLIWDRDRPSEQRRDFGGYNVYRSIGPDSAHATLLRRYILNPGRLFGDANLNPDNGAQSRMWTFRDDVLPTTGLFIDPDSILNFIRVPRFTGLIRSGVAIFDTIWERRVFPGPKGGFDYYYYVTICDSTENGEDLTPRSAGMVGPLVPTGASVQNNLDVVKVVPNPYSFHADWDLPGKRKIRFTNLPERVTITIYDVVGSRVRALEHRSAIDNGEDWDLIKENGDPAGPGIYIFRLAQPDGRERIGRFTVIR